MLFDLRQITTEFEIICFIGNPTRRVLQMSARTAHGLPLSLAGALLSQGRGVAHSSGNRRI